MKKCLQVLLALLLIMTAVLPSAGSAMGTKHVETADDRIEQEDSALPVTTDPHEIVTIMVKLDAAPVLETASVGETKAAEASKALFAAQDKVIAAISSELLDGEPLEPAFRYSLLFNGFAFRGEYRLIERIKALPGVADCYRSNVYSLPREVGKTDEPTRLNTSVGYINADDLWALGYSGQGMTIAVIDTGIKKDHPNFAAAPESPHFNAAALQSILDQYDLCAEQRYTGGTLTGAALYQSAKIPFTFNYYTGGTNVDHSTAQSDHGTHVSSICAGNDAHARGVAYNAQILSMQVFHGEEAEWAEVLAALEDCAYLRVDSVNMSLGADGGFTEGDADMEHACDLLIAQGVNLACAAGNSVFCGAGNNLGGYMPTFDIDNGLVSTPSTLSAALSVAASLNNASAGPAVDYSSWGTTSDLAIKPEIMAPGDNITAATDPNYSGDSYSSNSGTSMASPHIAGSMALIRQYVNSAFPGLSEVQKMNMVNTLLMSTAVPSRTNGVLWSPRLQGAGQADLAAAVATKAYIEVDGSVRPKLELGDDDARSGVFTLRFDIVNFGNTALTYTVGANVLIEGTSPTSVNGVNAYYMTGSPQDITSNVTVTKPSTVTVPANGRTTVTVTVNVNPYREQLNERFTLGAYIEGFIRLDGTVDLGLPFLGFYGDWEYPAVLDRGYYYDQYLGSSQYPATWGTNAAGSKTGSYSYVKFGENPFGATDNFKLDRASVSPNGDGKMDKIDVAITYLLRGCEYFRYEIVNAATGEVYYSKDIPWMEKMMENSLFFQSQPIGVREGTVIDPWNGAALPEGTTVRLRMIGYLHSYDKPFNVEANENAYWEIPITIDKTAPAIRYWELRNGQLVLHVQDNHYTAYVGVYADAACTQLIAEKTVAENSSGALSMLAFNVGNRQTVYVKVGDYAYNTRTQTISQGSGGTLDPVQLSGIGFEPGSITVYEGSAAVVDLVRQPAGANNYDVVYTCSNSSVAGVSGTMFDLTVSGVGQGTATVTAQATDRATGQTFTATLNVLVKGAPDLNDALNAEGGDLSFTSSGAYPWVVDMESYPGRVAARTTNAGHDSTESTVTLSNLHMDQGDVLSFDWYASCETGFDYLRFYANGSEITYLTGSDTGWLSYSFTAQSAGNYSFTWKYDKDIMIADGMDCAWLDEVKLTPAGEVPPEYTPGDVDNSGTVDVADALLALRYAMGLITLSDNAFSAADVNGSGNVDVADAVTILRYAMGLINNF